MDNRPVLTKALIIIGAILGAGVLGFVVGELSVDQTLPQLPDDIQTQVGQNESDDTAPPPPYDPDPDAPPLWLHAGAASPEGWDIFKREAAMAAASGIHNFVVPLEVGWGSDNTNAALGQLDAFVETDPQATFLLAIDLNPHTEWLQAHTTAQARPGDTPKPYASPAAPDWIDTAATNLDRLLTRLRDSDHWPRIRGVVLHALEGGRWLMEGGYDTSAAAREGFRDWLRGYYVTDDALQEAWEKDNISIATVAMPLPPKSAPETWYALLPEEKPLVDFARFTSDSVADAIAAITARVKESVGNDFRVYAPYGFTFEADHPAAGHFAMGLLLGSDIDGFIAPVSFSGRGLGSTGGLMGPAGSALAHDKMWFVLDDTRTGVARDPLSGSIQRLEGMRAEDVANVQMRNFALAITQDLGMIWSDPRAEGWLHAEDQWELFGHFDKLYREHGGEQTVGQLSATPPPPVVEVVEEVEDLQEDTPADSPDDQASDEETSNEGQLEEGELPLAPSTFGVPGDPMGLGLVIVVDEESRFYTHPRPAMDRLLLSQARDALLRVGVQSRICLLQDMLDGYAPEAPVYAFLNLVHLDSESRDRIHERLAAEGAAAIWHYAPGILEGRASSNNVSATVGMEVERFDGPHPAGSVFTLGGAWLGQNETFGERDPWDPLFYIVDEAADTLAIYQEGNKPSAAIRTLDAGWTSVYIAEPTLTAAFLREVFRILEQPLLFRPGRRPYFDTTYAGKSLIGIHSRKVGERTLDLGNFYDVGDLFDPNLGWLNRDGFVVPLKQGETRLLSLTTPSKP